MHGPIRWRDGCLHLDSRGPTCSLACCITIPTGGAFCSSIGLQRTGDTGATTESEHNGPGKADFCCGLQQNSRLQHGPSGTSSSTSATISWAVASCMLSLCSACIQGSLQGHFSLTWRVCRFQHVDNGLHLNQEAATLAERSWRFNMFTNAEHHALDRYASCILRWGSAAAPPPPCQAALGLLVAEHPVAPDHCESSILR